MKLRLLLAALVLVGTTAAARAQVGLYLNPIATRVSNTIADPSTFSFLGTSSTARTFWGVDYGAYYDFAHTGKLGVGLDLRGTDLHANNASLKDLLFGVRISGNGIHGVWRPYVQASIGGGWTKAEASKISVRKVNYRIYGGLDRPIAKHVDWRVVEVGYGTLETISSYTVGNGGNVVIPASKLLSVSGGLVFRF